MASAKLKIGLIYNKMPMVEELSPFNAYRFRKRGIIVKRMAITTIEP
jgi:hypothetical protein